MAKYLLRGSFTQSGWEGIASEGGSARRQAAIDALGSVGGSLEAFYFALGPDDFYTIVELPDNAAAIAITTAGNLSGKFSIHATALLTLEEIDQAMHLSVDFRSPGSD